MAKSDPLAGGTSARASALLGVYLNDHLAGATGGVELARRVSRACSGPADGKALKRIAGEIAQDRTALLDVMRTLDIPVRRYKVYAGWAAEKIGRLKLNGHVLSRSPLSDLLELEALRLGVEGKADCWRTLRALAEIDPRLDAGRLDDLLDRARRQADTLEELRTRTAKERFAVA